MFLYDKKENSIDVYSFNGNTEAMIAYRQKEMLQIPEKDRVVVAESYSYDMGEAPLFEQYAEHFDTKIIPMEYANLKKDCFRYHFLVSNITSKRNKNILLDSYYSGQLSDRNVARIQDINKLRYFLLSKVIYDAEIYDNRKKILKDIIELPESLYLLQMLEQGKFSLLTDKDITEQLDLFSLAHIDEISFEELRKMDACGISRNTFEEIIAKSENDEYVLKLIKK
ncbi:MAG: hypothetical protein J6B98_04035 [Bacilli bacterium]|nr:hypothetical protein [Bacilli bacterium]